MPEALAHVCGEKVITTITIIIIPITVLCIALVVKSNCPLVNGVLDIIILSYHLLAMGGILLSGFRLYWDNFLDIVMIILGLLTQSLLAAGQSWSCSSPTISSTCLATTNPCSCCITVPNFLEPGS